VPERTSGVAVVRGCLVGLNRKWDQCPVDGLGRRPRVRDLRQHRGHQGRDVIRDVGPSFLRRRRGRLEVLCAERPVDGGKERRISGEQLEEQAA
jgi:hypothetical protein